MSYLPILILLSLLIVLIIAAAFFAVVLTIAGVLYLLDRLR